MWHKEAITDGEIDALRCAGLGACHEDTRYPLWRGSRTLGNGECLNLSTWLVHRLGGHVGADRGHYVWLSPDAEYYIDLTGEHRAGEHAVYARNTIYRPLAQLTANDRTTRFSKRADRIFGRLDTLIRLGLDYAGDAYPAETPQNAADSDRFADSWNDPDQYWHDESDPTTPEGVYQFVYGNGQLEVSPNHGHEELAGHAGVIPAQHTGPFAAGHVVVTNGKATWEVQANVNLHSFLRILKDATKNYGWTWGGMTDASGQPIIDDFAPKKSGIVLRYVFAADHLYLGRTSAADLSVGVPDTCADRALAGTVTILGGRADVHPVHIPALPHLFAWADDSGLTLYSGNDNVIKTIPDLQQHDNYNPNTTESPNPAEPPVVDERLPTGLYRCPACEQLFPNWHEYQKHRREQESWGDADRSSPNSDYGLPQGDKDPVYQDGAHFHEMRQEPGITTGSVRALDPRDPTPQCSHCGGTTWTHASQQHGREGIDDYYCDQCDKPLYGWREPETELAPHPDPLMDNEPGSLTLPPTWSHIVVLPARTWREAARVDGFAKYAKAFRYDNDNYHFYVAYRNGDPLGYAAVGDDGNVQMMHSAVENEGIGQAIYATLIRHYASLYTHAAHAKTVALLQKRGWVQSKGQLWRWAKDKDPKDLLDAPLPFIYDVDKDKIFVGHPGARTSDIPGRFTPGGIVEGSYEPGGKVIIRSLTSVPYTIRHMIELWYYTHPQMEVKSVHLKDDAGKDTRLASPDIANTVRTAVAMDPAVQTAANVLMQAGGQVFAVGGAVRDAVLGKDPHDVDLMVTGLPAERVSHLLQSLPGRVDYTGKDFGVFRYRNKGHDVEIALPRREHSTGAGHQDFDVQADHTMKPEDDFYRRDFTANAMGVNLATGQLVDPFGGAADIKSGTLRTLNEHSLAEDPLRVVRALVANARHGLDPDEATRAQMSDNAHSLTHLPAERIQAELDKLMASANPARALRLAHETGVLKQVLPEVEDAFGFNQNNPHHELELGDHLLNVLDRISQRTDDPDLRLAAVLHDIGKPGSAWQDPETGSNHYYEHHVVDAGGKPTGEVLGANHEELGAQMAHDRMLALKYPTDRINRVHELVSHHMYPGFSTMAGARRFLARVGDHADDLFTLRWADQSGKDAAGHLRRDAAWNVDRNRQLVNQVREAGQAFDRKGLAITGNDLIQAGLPPGPMMGQLLGYLTEQVIGDPSLNTPETLLRLAGEFAKLNQDDNVGAQIQEGRQAAQETLASRLRGSQSQKLAQGDEEAQVGWTPSFPDSADAEEIHDQALEDHGQAPEALWNPGGLESAMGRAANYWHYGQGSPGERIADAAGALAHGIGMAQAFVDGNKRTAYHTTRYFLDSNGYGHLSPLEHDDEEFADHLIGHGQGTHSLEDTQRLFRSRL